MAENGKNEIALEEDSYIAKFQRYFLLELSQFKNDSIWSEGKLVLKLPRFFIRLYGVWKIAVNSKVIFLSTKWCRSYIVFALMGQSDFECLYAFGHITCVAKREADRTLLLVRFCQWSSELSSNNDKDIPNSNKKDKGQISFDVQCRPREWIQSTTKVVKFWTANRSE